MRNGSKYSSCYRTYKPAYPEEIGPTYRGKWLINGPKHNKGNHEAWNAPAE